MNVTISVSVGHQHMLDIEHAFNLKCQCNTVPSFQHMWKTQFRKTINNDISYNWIKSQTTNNHFKDSKFWRGRISRYRHSHVDTNNNLRKWKWSDITSYIGVLQQHVSDTRHTFDMKPHCCKAPSSQYVWNTPN